MNVTASTLLCDEIDILTSSVTATSYFRHHLFWPPDAPAFRQTCGGQLDRRPRRCRDPSPVGAGRLATEASSPLRHGDGCRPGASAQVRTGGSRRLPADLDPGHEHSGNARPWPQMQAPARHLRQGGRADHASPGPPGGLSPRFVCASEQVFYVALQQKAD